jgi:beta-mannosidase
MMLDLSGVWALADADGATDLPMRVPGDVHSALAAAGRIPDPYQGRNEYGVRWVADRDWTLTRRFDLPAGHGRRLLVVDGLDTVATVRVNGVVVLETDSAFREHVADVGHALRAGDNEIAIVLRSVTAEANARQAAQPFRVPYHAGNCPIPNGNMVRKPQCDFGWDWNIALAPTGITGRIGLVGAGGEVAGVTIRQEHSAGRVRLGVTATLRGAAAPADGWTVSIGGVVVTGQGERVDAGIVLEDPALWWPNGMGDQPLHRLVVTIGAASWSQDIALRDVRLVSDPDAAGRSFGLTVNGRPVFCRGANWIPADALPGRITEAAATDLLRSAAEANMNMVRVWGGGRYEPDWFYAACDRLGLLVWQDFMFSCHLYPATDAFLAEVEREVAFQAPRLAHRVALWCGDNELLGALTWFEESRKNRDRYLVAYDRLNRTVETALKRALPRANWWPSSPSPGPLSFGDAWHDDSSGDMHFWSVWHEGRDFEHYRDVRPRFCSEFGFQSYPSMEVIRRFAGPADLNIASPVMESHQKNAGGNARIAETMFRYFRFPRDFESFVWLSQVQQAVAIRTAVDAWRSLKPHCMGALYWQLNDTWPVASWSSLDHGGGWKILHHAARRFFEPVTVLVVPDDGVLRVLAVNDTAAPVTVEADFQAVSLDGRQRPLGSARAEVGTDAAVPLFTAEVAAIGPDAMFGWRWRASDGRSGRDIVPVVRHKALDLPDPGLVLTTRVEDGLVRARLSSTAVSFFATLEADRPGRFSAAGVPVLPGENVEIDFRPDDGRPDGVRIAVRDLHSATVSS